MTALIFFRPAAPVVALLLLVAPASRAQVANLARLAPGQGRAHLSAGLDPAVVTTIAYSRTFGLGGHTASWFAEWGLAAADADPGDMRMRAGGQAVLWSHGSWRIAGRGSLSAQHTKNSVYEGAGFGADLTALGGYYRGRWFAGALVGYDRTVVMLIEHTRWYRDNVYADAVDGWYRGASGILHAGPMAGVAVGPAEVAVRVEWRRMNGGGTLDPPVVGGLSVGVPF